MAIGHSLLSSEKVVAMAKGEKTREKEILEAGRYGVVVVGITIKFE